MNDLTIIYYTANVIPSMFALRMRQDLKKRLPEGTPVVCVSRKPSADYFPNNIVVDLPYHHLSIYRQALIGAKAAETKYIALCEDDVLYSPEHFKHRSSPGKFAYNMNTWNITTWGDPMFTQKLGGRKNLGNLICERELFIRAMEERFLRWPDDSKIDLGIWAEPSKYERQLDVPIKEAEFFCTNPPNIMFSHQTALSFEGLGTRKRLGEIRATELPYWGRVQGVRSLYE